MTLAVYRIGHVPDLGAARFRRYGSRAQALVAGALARAALVLPPGAWVGLRYALNPRAERPYQRLEVFIAGSREDGDDELAPWATAASLGQLFTGIAPSSRSEAAEPLLQATSVWLVRGAEELVPVEDQEAVLSYSVRLLESPKYDPMSHFQRLDDLLDQLGGPVTVDLLVRRVETPMEVVGALGEEAGFLAALASGYDPERRREGTAKQLWRHRDPVAARHQKQLEAALEMVVAGDVFEPLVRVAGTEKSGAYLVARAVASSLGEEGTTRVVEISGEEATHDETLESMRELSFHQVVRDSSIGEYYGSALDEDLLARVWKESQTRARRLVTVSRMTALCGGGHLDTILQLPVSSGTSFRTIALETEVGRYDPWPLHMDEALRLGRDLDRWIPIHLELEQLVKHVLIVGAAGSGKTSTAKRLTLEVIRHSVPVLVLEPVKGEYRGLLRSPAAVKAGLRVFTAGDEGVSPLRFNPLEVPPKSTVGEHIYAIKECFLGALPLNEGPMPGLLQVALEAAYERVGCQEWQRGEDCETFPTLEDLRVEVRNTLEGRTYTDQVKGNIEGALLTRFDPLCSLSVGRMFRTVRSNPPLPELLARPTIIEMERLPGEAKNLFTLFLMTHLDRSVRGWGLSERLKLLVLIEEAHNLVESGGRAAVPGVADPKARAGELLGKLAAELRGYGVGLVFIDQSAEAMAGDIAKNTTTKIIQRANDSSDVGAAAGFLASSPGLNSEVARLGPGEALLYHEGLYRAARVLIERLDLDPSPMTDEELLGVLHGREWFQEAWLERTREAVKRVFSGLRTQLDIQREIIRRSGGRWSTGQHTALLEMVREGRDQVQRLCDLLDDACGCSPSSAAVRRGAMDALVTLVEAARDVFQGAQG